MRKLSKIVSIVLSLALCLGMASPAFAASFADLQNAINGKDGKEFTAEDGSTRYGYAENKDNEGNHVSWGIEAWNGTRTENVYDENGDVTGTTQVETRNVQLKEDVEYNAETDTYGNNNGGVNIVNRDVTLDLNGHDMNLSPGAELDLEDGKFYKDGEALPAKNGNTSSVIRVAKNGKLTLDDTSAAEGKPAGKITGGGTGIENGSTVVIKGGDISQNSTRGVWNRQDSTLIMEGGSVSENTGLGVFNQNGTFVMTDGDITGNCGGSNGAGVSNSGKFTMNGGTISDNTAANSGGGVNNSGTFTMNDGTISGNTANVGAGVRNIGTFTMNDGTISGNTANVGAGVRNIGTFNMNGGTISGNGSDYSGGGVCNYKNFVMKGGTITDNSSKYTTYGALYNDSNASFTIPAGTVLSGKGGIVLEWKDGAPVTVESKETTYYFDEGRTLNKSEREDGLIITVKKDSAKVVTVAVPVEGSENVVVNSDGSLSGLPDGTIMTNADGSKPYLPHGGQINTDGTYTATPHTYTNQVTKGATCTEAGERADVCSCGDKQNAEPISATGHSYEESITEATCTDDGEKICTCTKCGDSYTEVILATGHSEGVWTVTTPAQPGVEGVESLICPDCGTVLETRSITALPEEPPVIPDDGPAANTAPAPATIADQEVPLAGLVSRQLLVSALYVRAGSPDGEDAEGEYTKALAWAAANGIIDQESDPEEVVTVVILRDIMTRYAKFLDVIFDVEIPGEDDEIVMNCNEILEKFFAELEKEEA